MKKYVVAIILVSAMQTAHAAYLTGTDRATFVANAMAGCRDGSINAINDLAVANANMARIQGFCACKANYLADVITPDDYVGGFTQSGRRKALAAQDACQICNRTICPSPTPYPTLEP